MYAESVFADTGRIVTPVRTITRVPLLPGDAGIKQTIDEMRKIVREASGNPVYKDIAIRLVPSGQVILGLPAYGQLFNSLRRTFRYVRDSAGIEELWKPDCHASRFLAYGSTYGDCDDAAIWAATLLSALNLGPFRWVTIANGKRGNVLNHVFIEVCIDGMWRTMDFLSPGMKRVRTVYWRG